MELILRFLRYASIAAAVFGVVAIVTVSRSQAERQLPPAGDPPISPPVKPYANAVAATGILEALSENVAIGVPEAGLVTEVFVKVSDAVTTGVALFKLDDRDLKAEQLGVRSQIEIASAQVTVSAAQLQKLESQLARLEQITDARAISKDELDNRTQDVAIGRAQVAAANAQLASTRSALERLNLLIERLTIRSPRNGEVIQLNIRAGEFAATSPRAPAMIIGETGNLQVRADVDEQNATRIRPGQPAYAYLKGDPTIQFPLKFLRVEPFVIPKVSLTGSTTERVDTRVLQVIYSLSRPENSPLYVGQQVDVYIDVSIPE